MSPDKASCCSLTGAASPSPPPSSRKPPTTSTLCSVASHLAQPPWCLGRVLSLPRPHPTHPPPAPYSLPHGKRREPDGQVQRLVDVMQKLGVEGSLGDDGRQPGCECQQLCGPAAEEAEGAETLPWGKTRFILALPRMLWDPGQLHLCLWATVSSSEDDSNSFPARARGPGVTACPVSGGAWHFWCLLRASEMGLIIIIINNGSSTKGTVLCSFFWFVFIFGCITWLAGS